MDFTSSYTINLSNTNWIQAEKTPDKDKYDTIYKFTICQFNCEPFQVVSSAVKLCLGAIDFKQIMVTDTVKVFINLKNLSYTKRVGSTLIFFFNDSSHITDLKLDLESKGETSSVMAGLSFHNEHIVFKPRKVCIHSDSSDSDTSSDSESDSSYYSSNSDSE